jgi:hypothetical protein
VCESGTKSVPSFLGLTKVIRMFSYYDRNCFVYKLIKTNVCLFPSQIDNLPEEF